MEKLLDILSKEMETAFEKAGYGSANARVTPSNRPDLCEFQCNGAMAAAKTYHKAPIMIAKDCVAALGEGSVFASAEAVPPGFINLKISEDYLARYIQEMQAAKKFGLEETDKPQTIIIDYGGANVAKPLHVGHLRPAIIGESVKRIDRYMGHTVIGDVHLGDWGLQMGLILTEVKRRMPELPYFDDDYTGEYPQEAPFTITDLEEIYPAASMRSKEDEAYRAEALEMTVQLQKKKRGYYALWKHILQVSVTDLKKNYAKLGVSFDLWKGESDAEPYIADMVKDMKEKGYAHEDQGALIVDVKEETDTKEIPPCIILKSDGASLYATTDLATLVERVKLYDPQEVFYITDKRQEMHFLQVFRTAKKTGIVKEETKLNHLGFGTMNGKDGKPFKTRDGGVMRLEMLLSDINEEMYRKMADNKEIDAQEAKKNAEIVGLAALKYGDLSNQTTKDYVFDIDRFTSFEGNTGPYILYTIVRMKSILQKYIKEKGEFAGGRILPPQSESEKALMLSMTQFVPMLEAAYEEKAPHKLCAFVYDLANAFNRFYHETKIMSEPDADKQTSWLTLLLLAKQLLETCIDLLGFEAPERM